MAKTIGAITFTFTPGPEPDIKEYILYASLSSDSGTAVEVARAQSSPILYHPPDYYNRYYWVKAIDFSGNLSGFSNRVNGAPRRVATADTGYNFADSTSQGGNAKLVDKVDGASLSIGSDVDVYGSIRLHSGGDLLTDHGGVYDSGGRILIDGNGNVGVKGDMIPTSTSYTIGNPFYWWGELYAYRATIGTAGAPLTFHFYDGAAWQTFPCYIT
jgi:hypothetical protein